MYITKRLDEIVDVNPRVALEKRHDYPFVEMEVVNPGFRYISANTRRVFSGGGAKFLPGDTLFARITPCLENGKIAQYKNNPNQPAFGSTEFIVFRCRPGISDPSYVFYLATSNIVRKPAENSMSGASGRQRADLAAIKQIKVPLPPLPVQRRIAAVLGAYDDLIENNRRRIAILEELARSLYREWFVHFRFPGHAGVEVVERGGVRAPEGWGVRQLSTVAHVNQQSIKRGREPGQINYIDIASVSPGKIDKVEYLPFSEAPGRARRIVKHGDTIWSTVRPNRKSYSLILQPAVNTVVSTGFAVLTPATVPYSYLYLATTTDEFASYLTNRAKGSAYPAVIGQDFEEADIIVPTTFILEAFHRIVADILEAQQVLHVKNTNLRRTRDLLLPRLVSGELDVSELEIAGVEYEQSIVASPPSPAGGRGAGGEGQ